ncbi:cytochrome c oxidase subunit II (mitochondrion) [Priapulus caudatus]|uniref:Cytochrome c oxidase subunit 2 n=1 Tax=Priapulus caudatus TaxID=37621 RepID=A0MCU7_PRICU|nr:cytochrome c oxidase subunit II [Priapulus caudatus]ABE03642.1 cytochrome c oxidase subunit 2 [Priapulus caudatus]
MATWGQLMFQDSASPLMEQLIFFHDHILFVLILITVVVGYFMIAIMTNSYINRFMLEGQEIETIWTIIPAIILIFVALPSLRLLYLLDEVNSPSITIKTIGHQWYWSYEYSDFNELEFDSFMIPSTDLEEGQFRLLDVDNRLIIPMENKIRVLVTAADVLHSWAIPSMGIKVDAVPGRLNQLSFFSSRPGVFYGQCSEICGANHSFMPIVLEVVDTPSFIKWVSAN